MEADDDQRKAAETYFPQMDQGKPHSRAEKKVEKVVFGFIIGVIGFLLGAMTVVVVDEYRNPNPRVSVYRLVFENGLIHTLAQYDNKLWMMDLIPLTDEPSIIDVYKRSQEAKAAK